MTKIYRITGEILFEDDSLNLKELVEKHKKDLYGSYLYGADLIRADLREADLRGVNLRDANLNGADLRGAKLYGADLRGVDLIRADLRDANLIGVDLKSADLRGAKLYGADLKSANLYGVNLRDANLMDAKIGGETILNYKEISGIGNNGRLLRCFLLNDNSFYFMAGCFSGTEQELKEKVINKYGSDCEYIEAIEFLKNLCIKYKGK